ncbi:alpha/beta fold hydrolase [Blastomonas sp.]|uniref:alpha/beta fold hydrolase n=1 Tax=Blastomonas sp. TaxID=1909299 RepID=UPI0035935CCD
MTEQVIYFHGLPGGAGELALFDADVAPARAHVHVLDRSCGLSPNSRATYFATLAAAIQTQNPGAALRLVGFSLGASAALRTAPFLGSQVASIDLISAAAPLGLGDYLDGMAGAPVFRLARSSPLLFAALARLQSGVARIAPGKLYDALFASAQGEDRTLSADPAFKAAMLPVLQQSLGPGLGTYRREIALYVQDWVAELDRVTQPVTLYHGSADNWSPATMAQDLAHRLPRVEALHLLDGLSHYSTLREYGLR